MVQKMPGQLRSLKPRKRKINSEAKSSRKASATRRRCSKSPKTPLAMDGNATDGGYSNTDAPLEKLSEISCECQHTAGRRRCSASPDLDGREGKENELRTELGVDKQEPEDMDCDDTSKHMFPDDDSNQILPVEQFFGNLDTLQEFPQRSSASSVHARRKNRRRHYYAPEDSDEDEVDFGGMQRDDGGDI